MIRLFETNTGKALSQVVTHEIDIANVQLSQTTTPGARRLLAFVDRNGDLHVCTTADPEPVKLASVVDSVRWHDKTDMLMATSDQKMVVWCVSVPAPVVLFFSLSRSSHAPEATHLPAEFRARYRERSPCSLLASAPVGITRGLSSWTRTWRP